MLALLQVELLMIAVSARAIDNPSVPTFLVESLQNFMGGSVSVILICIVKTFPCTEVQRD